MLHVAFFELMRGGAEYLCARQFRFGIDQRHHVLQLVAEAVSPARLIERRTRPDTADQRLIQQPTIQHQVHCRIRRADFEPGQGFVPVVRDALNRFVDY